MQRRCVYRGPEVARTSDTEWPNPLKVYHCARDVGEVLEYYESWTDMSPEALSELL